MESLKTCSEKRVVYHDVYEQTIFWVSHYLRLHSAQKWFIFKISWCVVEFPFFRRSDFTNNFSYSSSAKTFETFPFSIICKMNQGRFFSLKAIDQKPRLNLSCRYQISSNVDGLGKINYFRQRCRGKTEFHHYYWNMGFFFSNLASIPYYNRKGGRSSFKRSKV